jgi:oligopeptide transport system ATP-binding protein
MIKKVGLLPEHLNRYQHEFSGGQRQRVGIARSLILSPKFIVADEPISALDVSIRAQVLNLITDFKKELGLSCLFIAHDLSIVKHISNRIAVIFRGRIVELASSDELFLNPIHPYTKALLSAIPNPNPSVKEFELLNYEPATEHFDYLYNFPSFVEISSEHFVFGNEREIEN